MNISVADRVARSHVGADLVIIGASTREAVTILRGRQHW